MDAIIKKLAVIEETAEAIVENAEKQKFQAEKEIQEKRDAFDRQMDAEVNEQLEKIWAEGKEKMETLLEEERGKHRDSIEALEKEFSEHHTEYAKEIMKRIIEV